MSGAIFSERWYADAPAILLTLLRHRYQPCAYSEPEAALVAAGALKPVVSPACACGWHGDAAEDDKAYDQWVAHAVREIRGPGA